MRKGLTSLVAMLAASPLFLSETSVSFANSAMAHVEGNAALIEKLEGEFASTSDDYWPDPDSWLAYYRPYIVRDGILTIPVDGLLINKLGYCLPGWMTGYEYIQRAYDRGLGDANVRGIALVIDSPGGMCSGCFELVDHLYENRDAKPLRAFASDSCYSAAYNIGSVAPRLTVSRSGGTGSVGVMSAHVSVAGALEKQGIKITLIYAGKHKVDGTPYADLTDQAKTRMTAKVGKLYDEFVSTVARNRGMDEKEVRATEAMTYDAADSVEVGFADDIGNAETEILGFARDLEIGDQQMTTPTAPVATAPLNDAQLAEARAEGTRLATERMTAILSSPEGKDRPKAAMNAVMTSMASAEAISFLGTLPKEEASAPAPVAAVDPTASTTTTAAAPTPAAPAATAPVPTAAQAAAIGQVSHFAQHMNAAPQPGIAAGDGGASAEANPVNDLMSAYTQATGFKFKTPAVA